MLEETVEGGFEASFLTSVGLPAGAPFFIRIGILPPRASAKGLASAGARAVPRPRAAEVPKAGQFSVCVPGFVPISIEGAPAAVARSLHKVRV